MAQEIENKIVDCEKVINANLFKKNKKLEKSNCWNDIISKLVVFYKKTDDELKELSQLCSKEDDVR
jgi:hypothetical protein